MSWLSSLGSAIGNVAKKVGSVVKKVATPLASFAVGFVPGVGPLLSKGVDILGNKLLGEEGDASSDAGQQAADPVSQYMAAEGAPTLELGSSPAAVALANSSKGFLGIGDGKPGVAGIGDGKPGILGIGTGKAKAKKEAAETARQQAEDAAKGEGLSPTKIKLAGAQAASKAEDHVERNYEAPDKSDKSDNKSILYIILAAVAAAIL